MVSLYRKGEGGERKREKEDGDKRKREDKKREHLSFVARLSCKLYSSFLTASLNGNAISTNCYTWVCKLIFIPSSFRFVFSTPLLLNVSKALVSDTFGGLV